MIRVDGAIVKDTVVKEAKYTFFADTKEEVTDAMTGTVGLLDGFTIQQGSSVITADGEFAFRKSDGTWNWIGEDE